MAISNVRIRTLAEASDSSDYANARRRSFTTETAATRHLLMEGSAATAGTTIDLSPYTTIPDLIVDNKDSTNHMWVEYYQQVGAYAAGSLGFTSASHDTILDNNSGNFATTPEFASVGDWVRIASSENSGENDGLFGPIESISDSGATNDLITLAHDTQLTTNATDTTATLSFERKNRLRVAAGSQVRIQLPVIAGDILLTASTSAVKYEIWGSAT